MVHESSVNYENLIRDLADMYPFDVAEVVLVELIANSLDAGAQRISIVFDPQAKVLSVQDDGRGMSSNQFEEYHNLAAGLKSRGEGIGFAGLGAKISFNVADKVVSETRTRGFSAGSDWYLDSKKRLVWKDIEPEGLVGTGTRVRVHFRRAARIPYSSRDDLVRLIRQHYLPLLDVTFLDLYQRLDLYSKNLRFVVNGGEVAPVRLAAELGLEKVKEFFPECVGKRIGYGILGVAGADYPLGPITCGVGLCTRGKVIKWEMFSEMPGEFGPRILSVVEVPDFVRFLTTSKTDFTRRNWRELQRLYSPIREEFRAWLRELGVEPQMAADAEEARRIERELKRILDDVPELSEFFGFRARKSVLVETSAGQTTAAYEEGVEATFPVGEGVGSKEAGPLEPGDSPGQALVERGDGGDTRAKPISRVGRRGPGIGFSDAPDRLDLAWIEGSNVIINTGHPCYRRTQSAPLARRMHSLFAIAAAVQRFLAADATSRPDLMFTDRMMAAWGKT